MTPPQIAAHMLTAAAVSLCLTGSSAHAEEPVLFPPKISLADDNLTLKFGGFIQWDLSSFDNDVFDYDDGGTVRRGRLNVSGTFLKDFAYVYEMDFAPDRPNITDAYIAYNGIKDTRLQVGQFKEPFNLEVLISDQWSTFVERPAIETFAPARNLGGAARFWGEHWTAAAGVFGNDTNSNSRWDEDYAFTVRATYAPIIEKDMLLHVGAAGSYRVPDSADSVQFSSRPENRITDHSVVNTGRVTDVDHTNFVNLEAAGAYGPFTLRGEYTLADVNRDASPDVQFDGWYVMASYFLTGENYEYKKQEGIFGQPKIAHPLQFNSKDTGWGAWEIAGRISNLDLNDASITGGEMTNYTVALNWYWNDNVRVMLDYTWVDTDSEASPPSDRPQFILLRTQLRF